MASLYSIQEEELRILAELMENGGELTEELEARYTISEQNKADKFEAYAKMIRQLLSDAKAYADEKAFYEAKAKTAKASAEFLKKRLKDYLLATDTPKYQAGAFKFSVYKSGTPSLVLDEEKLGEEWKKTVVTPDNEKIKEALKEGEEIEGASLSYSDVIRIS